MPGLFFNGLIDLQRRFLIQTGKPQIVLISQVLGTCAHLLFNCVFILWFRFGLVGAALSGSLSSLIILALNLYGTRQITDIETNTFKITDLEVTESLKEYAINCLPLLTSNLVFEAGFFYITILGF